MKVTVALEPRAPAALEAFATAVSTPGSSVYRQFLSVAQFRQRFAPADAQIAAVEASLRARGLSPSPVSANGLAISVTATAGAVEHAFSTSLQRVALPSGRTAYVNAQAPLLDSSVSGLIHGVVGLDNLYAPHPVGLRTGQGRVRSTKRVVTGGPQPCAAATSAASANHTYTTDQIASAYGFPGLYGAGDFGAGQTVAIYELEGNFHSDITAYESCYGITAPVSYAAVDGGPGLVLPGDGLETALDIENVVGLAPKANVIVYQGPNSASNLPGAGPYDVYNTIVSQDAAKVISTSWGICEPQDNPVPTAQQDENTLFQEAAVQGQSIFSASGDNGSEDCGDTSLTVDDPASQPFVTGGGGTSLSALGPPPSESVWNDICQGPPSGPCGGGGGISKQWPMPSYQSGAPAALRVINASSSGAVCGAAAGSFCREVPDVSANADPSTGYTIYYEGSFANGTPLGGTSAVAPLWAALMAEVNASAPCGGVPIGFANPTLYGTAGHAYAGRFNDITAGNNDILGTNGGVFAAGPGYDMASGLGSPNATALAANVCAPTIGVSNPGSQTSRVGTRLRLQIIASDSAGDPVSFTATSLPPGLSIGAASGVVSGTPTTPGVYTVTVHAVDTRGSLGITTFGWTVRGLPKQSRASLTGVGKGQPKLAFTLTAGTGAPKLKKIVVALPRGLAFARNARSLRNGITLRGRNGGRIRPASLKVSGGKLAITLSGAGTTQVRVTIAPPALSASSGLVGNVQSHRSRKLGVTLKVVDAGSQATTIAMKLKPS
jgi:subtilase family serine protease